MYEILVWKVTNIARYLLFFLNHDFFRFFFFSIFSTQKLIAVGWRKKLNRTPQDCTSWRKGSSSLVACLIGVRVRALLVAHAPTVKKKLHFLC